MPLELRFISRTPTRHSFPDERCRSMDRLTTDVVDIDRARDYLDYAEMLALANLFEQWALHEPNIDEDRRTKLIQLCCDYERIAAHCGPEWRACLRDKSDPLHFIAGAYLKRSRPGLPLPR
jgi:hypothetical protein